VFVAGALVIAALAGQDIGTGGRYALVVLLAIAMGIQNTTARQLAVPDLTTTVLTTTLTGVAADSPLAGGHGSKLGRRALSVAAMLLGALIGGLLVLKVDADQELKPIAPQPPPQLEAARKVALDKLNGYRVPLGLPPVAVDPAIAAGAEAHAYFFLFNYGQAQLGGLGVHIEDPALPGFTGENSLLRSRHFGYSGNRGGEVINHVFTPQANVQSWVDSVYHRFPVLDHETRAEGYGEAQVGIVSISVMDFGFAGPAPADPIVYPAASQKDVPAAFIGNEIPDPVPQTGTYPTGYPVTLQVGGADKLTVTSGRLLISEGQEVPSYTLLPATSSLGANEWALLAHQPLTPGVTYTAEVIGQVNGHDFSKRWSFTVVNR
jgi:uncharacterized protein YkwD